MSDDATILLRDEESRLRAVEEQMRWEASAAERGARRYHEAAAGLTLDQTPPGLSILRDAMPGVIAEVTAAMEEAKTGIAEGGAGRQPFWWWAINMLPPEQTAALALRCLLAGSPKERELGNQRSLATMALGVATQMHQQIDFEQWKLTQREATKAAKRKGEDVPDLVAALKSRTKRVDTKAWRRWSQKIKRVAMEPWSTDEKLLIGAKIVECTVRGAGGWFEIGLVRVAGGKTQRRIWLTPLAVTALEDMSQRAALAAPLRLPMLCPPRAWRYEPPKEKEAA